MSNFDRLTLLTASERRDLQAAPVIQRALRGDVTHELYRAFLEQAYHHVRHTVPLLMAVGARLPQRHHWLQKELIHYLEEEQGHEEWILSDIDAAGGNASRVRTGAPGVETDAMVAYAYDIVMRRNPIGFFGMVFVLEGTSVALALNAAAAIQGALDLPSRAFTYLRSHGSLDQQHVGHLKSIVDRFDTSEDLPAVVSCARAMYWLYGSVFRALDRSAADPTSVLKGAA
jgi:pyrroloquinoline quinone (PQQ) biosynthesis protein C